MPNMAMAYDMEAVSAPTLNCCPPAHIHVEISATIGQDVKAQFLISPFFKIYTESFIKQMQDLSSKESRCRSPDNLFQKNCSRKE